MRRRSLPPELLPVHRAVRVFVYVDLAALALTLACLAIRGDPLVALLWGFLLGAPWVIADLGLKDLEPPLVFLRQVLGVLIVTLGTLGALTANEWNGAWVPWSWLLAGQALLSLLALVLGAWALRVVARQPRRPIESGPLPAAGPAGQPGAAAPGLSYSHSRQRT